MTSPNLSRTDADLKAKTSATGAAVPGVRRNGNGNNGLLESLGKTVRAARDTLGLSRQALAGRARLSARYLAQLEGGIGNISIAKLDDVASALGLTAAQLLIGETGGNSAGDEEGGDGGNEARLRREVAERVGRCGEAQLHEILALLGDGAPPAPAKALVTLIGLRGAGKSTVGPLLGSRLGCPFHELDDLIEEEGGLAVPEIFELHGEAYYRQAEWRVLADLIAQGRPAVVAVSGGIVNDAKAFALLMASTRLVWLRTSPEEHMSRVEAQGDHRPMRNRPDAMAELKSLLDKRTPLYRQAGITIDTSQASPEECVATLAAALA